MARLCLIGGNPDGSPKFIETDTDQPPEYFTDYIPHPGFTGTVLRGHSHRIWTPVGRYSEALNVHYFEHIPED